MHKYVALLRMNFKFSSLGIAILTTQISPGLAFAIPYRLGFSYCQQWLISSDFIVWLDEQVCPFVTADPTWAPSVSGIVRKHQTPLITVKQSSVDRKVEVHVMAAEKLYQSGNGFCSRLLNTGATILGFKAGSPYLLNLTIPYVCISHVWAESVSLRWHLQNEPC